MQRLDHQSPHSKSELELTLSTKHVTPLVVNSNAGRQHFVLFNQVALADGWGCGKVTRVATLSSWAAPFIGLLIEFWLDIQILLLITLHPVVIKT